ncbi:MAG: lysylphosphatidylglycerol synthase transmembrane domain-containing protein [Chloroflexota bacterium]|jgi:glycosyltransferase 2 family protein
MGKFVKANRKKLIGLSQILLSLVLLVWLFRRVSLAEVVQTLANIHWGWYALAFLLFQLNVVIRAWRWYILLHTLNDRPRFTYLVYLYYIGFFANNFIPSGFGGDLVKVVSLRQSYGRGAEALSSVLMERVTGLVGSSLIALAALLWNVAAHTMTLELPAVLWALIILTAGGIPLAFLIARLSNPLTVINRYYPKTPSLPFYSKFENLVNTIHRYPPRALLFSLLISLPFTLNLILVQVTIAWALGIHLPFRIFALFVPIIAIINLLPITFNGLGLREGIYTFLFVPIGVPAATAVSMSLAFYFLRFSAGLLGGLLYALRSVLHFARAPDAQKL